MHFSVFLELYSRENVFSRVFYPRITLRTICGSELYAGFYGTAIWHDEKDKVNSGQYVIQILRLAG